MARRALRVVRLVADYPVGGRASYGLQPVYHNLSKAQAARGHDVQVIARRYAGQPETESVEGVTIHRVGPPFTANAALMTKRLSDEREQAVIHTHSTSGFFLSLVRNATRTPIISHVHGTTYSVATPAVLTFGSVKSEYSPWRVTTSYLRERALWSRADRIAAVSSSVRSDLIERYQMQPDKIRLVFNGVDAELFRPVSPPTMIGGQAIGGRKIVLYVGHFGLRKGIPFLIRAMAEVTKEVREATLVCVGGVPPWLPSGQYMDSLNRMIRTAQLEGKVLLLDRVPNESLPELYSSASAFVLPSYYEAFPKVLIEAMACERAVIATKPGGTSDSVDDGVNGFLVPYADTASLATRIVALLGDEGLARRMGSKGRERVLKDFTWQAVAARVDGIYDEFTVGRRAN